MKILYIVIGIMILALLGSFMLGKKNMSEQTFVDNEEMTGEMLLDDDGMGNQMDEDMGMFNEEMNIDSEMSGQMIDYTNPSDLANLTGINILFFKATWCPTCKQLTEALIMEKDNIPSDVTIWLVDYDENKDMRVEYGVTMQHTLVQIDGNLEEINSWRGSLTLEDVLKNIK